MSGEPNNIPNQLPQKHANDNDPLNWKKNLCESLIATNPHTILLNY